MEKASDVRCATRDAVAADLRSIRDLLVASDLPVGGVDETALAGFAVATAPDGNVVGGAAIEVYGKSGLLRSVVIRSDLRGAGIGRALVENRIKWCRARKLDSLYLLTTTAPAFFERFGFERIDRSQVAAPVLSSAEFRELCPSSAIAMQLRLAGPRRDDGA